jgi:lysozyme
MKLSQNGVNFIKAHEALRLKAYQDSKGVWTIGWGHTKGVKPGDVITREQAEQFIRDDFAWVERTLNSDLVTGRDKPLVTQNEFDALCSLVFNIGSDAYLESTVRRKIKQGDKMAAARAFKMWVYSEHKFIQGLANRRADEVRLFLQSGQADIAALLLGAMMAGAAVLVAMIFVM